jgi:flagellar biosynthesis protein FliR
MPLKVLIGIFLMFTIMAPALLGIYDSVFHYALLTLEEIVRGMASDGYE